MIWTVITQKERCTKMAEISQNEWFRQHATVTASGGFWVRRNRDGSCSKIVLRVYFVVTKQVKSRIFPLAEETDFDCWPGYMIIISSRDTGAETAPWDALPFALSLISFCLIGFWDPQNFDEWHRIQLVRNPSSENSGNTLEGKAYWRGVNQTLANQLFFFSRRCESISGFGNENQKQLIQKNWRRTSEKHPAPLSRWWRTDGEFIITIELIDTTWAKAFKISFPGHSNAQ